MSISIQIPLTKYKFGQEVTVFCDILSPFSVKILNVDKISMFFSGERTASTSHSSLTNRILVGTTENFELIPEINTIEIKFQASAKGTFVPHRALMYIGNLKFIIDIPP